MNYLCIYVDINEVLTDLNLYLRKKIILSQYLADK